MPDIFLSYSRDDQPIARRFAEAFERAGFSVWWDATLHSGEAYDEVTEKALLEARAVVVLWSKKSVASRWVRAEATQADRNKTLVPVMIEPCVRPIMFELTHTADLAHWSGDSNDKAWQAYLADVRRFVERGSPSLPTAAMPVAGRPPPIGDRSIVRHIAIAVVALLVAGAALWALTRTRGEQGTPAATAAAAPAAPATSATASAAQPAAASIAVVPFANLTGEPAKEYFSDGMAEELINALAKVPGLNVASRTSSFAYKGKNSDIRQIALELGVATILEGSVRSAGERVRITAQLTNARSGYQLWSESYDRKFTDLFKLQDDLAREIVTAYKRLVNADLPAFESQAPPTQDLEAYGLYLQAVSAQDRATDEGARDAIVLAEQAVARDPMFARGHLLLASARLLLSTPPLADVERDAKRAKDLDPSLETNGILGLVQARRGNWLAAEEFFKGASASAYQQPGFHNSHALSTLWPTGQVRAALGEFSEAGRLAPAMATYPGNLARASSNVGHDAEALEQVKAAVARGVDPTGRRVRQIFADAASRAGRNSEAAALMITLLPATVLADGGEEAVKRVYAAFGEPAQRAGAVASLQSLTSRLKPEDWVVKVFAKAWYTQLGALDHAYALGDQLREQFASEGQSPVNAWSWLWSPEMRAFRLDPRFHAFVTRLGMIGYWNKYGPPDDCELKSGKLNCR